MSVEPPIIAISLLEIGDGVGDPDLPAGIEVEPDNLRILTRFRPILRVKTSVEKPIVFIGPARTVSTIDQYVFLYEHIKEVNFGRGLCTILLIVSCVMDIAQIAAVGAPALRIVVVRMVTNQGIMGHTPQFNCFPISRWKSFDLCMDGKRSHNEYQPDHTLKRSVH